MKKLWLAVTLILVLSILAACNGDSEKSSGASKQTLEVALWDEMASEAIDASIEAFQKDNPDVKVNVTYTPWADYWTKLRTSIGGGSGPDVFWMNGPNFQSYVQDGLIKNLEPFIDGDEEFEKSSYYDVMIELYTYEDELYAAPYFVDTVGLYYNKRIFDEAGVDYPDETWTWDTVKEVGAKLTDPEKGIFGYNTRINSNQYGYYNYINQAGGFVIDKEKTKSGFNTAEAKEAFDYLEELIEEGISPSAQAQIETEADQFFFSGKVAMVPAVSVRAADWQRELGDDLGIAPLPSGPVNDTAIVHGLGWAMNAKSKNEDLAWELIKSLSGDEGTTVMAETGFGTPAYKDKSDIWVNSLEGVDLQLFIDALETGTVYPVSARTSEWQTVETTEIQSAFLGQQTIDEALEKIEAEMNAILAEEKAD